MKHLSPVTAPRYTRPAAAAAPGIEGVLDSLIALGTFLVGYKQQKEAIGQPQ